MKAGAAGLLTWWWAK